jgi:dolichol-phosphate mannosyltransferase
MSGQLPHDIRRDELNPVTLSIVVPTFNESGNVRELINRVALATAGLDVEMIFVDDSTDDTPFVIADAAKSSSISVRLLHRATPVGGLGGAVVEGMQLAEHDWVLVMDGDLQHPPEMIPIMAAIAANGDAGIVVASRYRENGDAGGLSSATRRAVSNLSTILTRAMFPSRLRDCTDPMTGFFMVKQSAVSVDNLEPRGFKILLEIIARQPRRLDIREVPFAFGERFAGTSKASLLQGFRFLRQLIALRFGRMSGFALIGALGAVANIAIVAVLTRMGVQYLYAAAIAAEVTIIANFFAQERFVFGDLSATAGSWISRFTKSFLFNNAEAAIRIPFLFVLVDLWGIAAVPATALTLLIAFAGRYVFHSRMIYAPPRSSVEVNAADIPLPDATLRPTRHPDDRDD